MKDSDGPASSRAGGGPWLPPPLRRGAIILAIGFALVVGFVVTGFWLTKALELQERAYLAQHWPQLLPGLGLAALLTLGNIVLRWGRWHFLMRRVGAAVETRDSLLIYLSTLPMLLTPFLVGELVRVALLGRKYARYRFDVAGIWLLERASDLLALCLVLSVVRARVVYVAVAGLGWLVVLLLLKMVYRQVKGSEYPSGLTILVLLISSLGFGLIPPTALYGIERLLSGSLGFVPALEVAIGSTVLGTITGLPAGVGLTGSVMVSALQQHGAAAMEAINTTLFFRLGTTWFAVGVGVTALVLARRRLLQILRAGQATSHFDRLAEHYDEQLPAWIRDRLLARKTTLMHEALEATGCPTKARGLDIGCGPGWHACEMVRRGYEMAGIDESDGQVGRAAEHAKEQDLAIDFRTGSAAKLPFGDEQFDFVYAINVLHHVTDEAARARVFGEIVRVLKPDGVFFLHEVNTSNWLFRIYLGYLFPLMRGIDEGTEKWLRPDGLPKLDGATWSTDVTFFTFLPDFLPASLARMLAGIERHLEGSRFARYSAHYVARLTKHE